MSDSFGGLFDADEYLSVVAEPLAPAPQEPAEPESAIELLGQLNDDAPESLVDSLVEEIAIEENANTELVIDISDEPSPDLASEPASEPAPEQEAWALSVDALWSGVVAQDVAVRSLRAAAQRPVHAYLLVGQAGVGVRQAATAFAAALLCPSGGCATCIHCTRALGERHPDLIIVEREGASISVDQAREIIRLATRSPVEGARKVLVLVDFHLVTNAASTLLKIIEEPPESTIFVVLADHLPPELVTIASRCLQVPFRSLTVSQVTDLLVERGVPQGEALRSAVASGGRLDRALLLSQDANLADRLAFWEAVPSRLDGSGAAVSVLAAESVAILDSAAVGPLEARQAEELSALETRLEALGGKGGVGQRKELVERHKRELKRLRDDELRVGLAAIQRGYRDALVTESLAHGVAVAALEALDQSNAYLDRNPNLSLLLQSLYLRLAPLPAR